MMVMLLFAEEAIGWMRVVRPGSVIGPQQYYMKDIQPRMWAEGERFRSAKTGVPRPLSPNMMHQPNSRLLASAASASASAASTSSAANSADTSSSSVGVASSLRGTPTAQIESSNMDGVSVSMSSQQTLSQSAGAPLPRPKPSTPLSFVRNGGNLQTQASERMSVLSRAGSQSILMVNNAATTSLSTRERSHSGDVRLVTETSTISSTAVDSGGESQGDNLRARRQLHHQAHTSGTMMIQTPTTPPRELSSRRSDRMSASVSPAGKESPATNSSPLSPAPSSPPPKPSTPSSPVTSVTGRMGRLLSLWK